MKNILMLVHIFPPRGSVGGSIRLLKFLKYIRELRSDMRCTVLTVRDDIVLLNDPHLSEVSLSEIPYDITEIIRTYTLQPRNRTNGKRTQLTGQDNTILNKNKIKGLIKLLYDFVDKYFFIPDYGLLWFPYSIPAALKIIRNNNVDVLYATAPPFSVLLQAAIISRLSNRKLIIDIKDDWIYQTKFRTRPFLFRKIEERMEKFCIRTAHKVILVTQDSYNDFSRRYPSDLTKFELITNGCDVDEYRELWNIPHKKNKKFTIIHSGLISHTRRPAAFLKAIVELKNRGIIDESNFQLVFIGVPSKDMTDYISRNQLHDVICIKEPLPRSEYIQEISKADLLLAFNYQIKTLVPGKLYDYWGARRPILLIDNIESMAAKLLRTNNLGVAVDVNDTDGIITAIRKYFNLWNEGCIESTEVTNLFNYDRKYLTQKLINLLDTV